MGLNNDFANGSVIAAMRDQIAEKMHSSKSVFIDTLVDVIRASIREKGSFTYECNRGDCDFKIEYGLATIVDSEKTYLPFICVEVYHHDSDDDVPFTVRDNTILYYPITNTGINRAIHAFLSLMYFVHRIDDKDVDLKLASFTMQQLADYYVEFPFEKVHMKVRRGSNQRHIDLLRNTNVYVYYDDGLGPLMVVYPSREHVEIVRKRLGEDTFSYYFTEVAPGRHQDQLFKLPDSKVMDISDLAKMMEANYNVKLKWELCEPILEEAYRPMKAPTQESPYCVITVAIAKSIQAAHGIDMS
jgi:hypothetical protein